MRFLKLILLTSFVLPCLLNARPYRILIDPGHGGKDQGASQGLHREATIAWLWSLELKKQLFEKNFEVELSRAENTGVSIKKRLQLIHQKKPDLVISLHANNILDPRAKGVEYYAASPLNLDDQKLKLAHEEVQMETREKTSLAELSYLKEAQRAPVAAILNDLQKQSYVKESLRLADKLNQSWPGKVKQGPFDLLEESKAPALIIELGFLSNPEDLKNLLDPQFRLEKSLKIAEAISGYFRKDSSSSELRFVK